MKRSFVLLSVALGLSVVAPSNDSASAATGLTTCSVSVDHSTVYPVAAPDKYSAATFTIDTSATLVTPAEFYWLVVGSTGGNVSNLQSTTNVTPVHLPWTALLNLATNGQVSTFSTPTVVEFQVSNFPQLNQPWVCRTSVTLMPNGKPSAPAGVTSSAGDASVIVEWSDVNGFEGVTYRVVASPGASTCTVDHPEKTCTVKGLENGTPYTFTVTAESSGGTSDTSAPSSPVTPVAGRNNSPRGPGRDGLAHSNEPKLPDTGDNFEGALIVSMLLMGAGSILRRRRNH